MIGDGGCPNINYNDGSGFSSSDHVYVMSNKCSDQFNLKYNHKYKDYLYQLFRITRKY